ncbi:hypothetical protein S40288_05491 [Stachybotrys chartarum IBT 40288]|nr:hypothetical protein S40288_05491 [Stachybotrys chartarum IBT 40288]
MPKVAETTVTKPKRVRTGCLTCRRRHLKCDEAMPKCFNCRKSSRKCERGVRLNFLDALVGDPPVQRKASEWRVTFIDESRDIASEYKGGLLLYSHRTQHTTSSGRNHAAGAAEEANAGLKNGLGSACSYNPPREGCLGLGNPPFPALQANPDHLLRHGSTVLSKSPDFNMRRPTSASSTDETLAFNMSLMGTRSPLQRNDQQSPNPLPVCDIADSSRSSNQGHGVLTSGEYRGTFEDAGSSGEIMAVFGRPQHFNTPLGEVLFMKIYVEEVGNWLDTLNDEKLFSQQIPYHALKSTVLLNALLACGARQLSFKIPELKAKAIGYYNTAVHDLLQSVGDSTYDLSERATAAVVLHAYEIMSDTSPTCITKNTMPQELIQQCGWTAQSTGMAGACFWLNTWIEVTKSLAYSFHIAWEPDPGSDEAGNARLPNGVRLAEQEDVWLRRILSILAAIANFRASMRKQGVKNNFNGRSWDGSRLMEWQSLKRLCDDWDDSCPRAMRPVSYVEAADMAMGSRFPFTMLPTRTAKLARLFYHTSQSILAQTYPAEPFYADEETRSLELFHAHQVCGIVSQSQEASGIAPAASQCLIVAAAVLSDPAEQDEALELIDRLDAQTGWRLDRDKVELVSKWARVRGRV